MSVRSWGDWKVFSVLLGGGVLGTLAILPYVLATQYEVFSELSLPIPVVLLVSLLQTTVLLAVAIFLGLNLGKRIGLGVPLLTEVMSGCVVREKLVSVLCTGIKLGALAGVLIVVFDAVFRLFMDPISTVEVPLWKGFLAAFYGGIVEEILLRFFLMTLIVWLLWRLTQTRSEMPTGRIVWTAIIVAAVLFGLGHLPATAALTVLTPLVVFRAIILNGIGGVIFGWLYWKRGLEAAIIAHFATDIVLLVVVPLALRCFT